MGFYDFYRPISSCFILKKYGTLHKIKTYAYCTFSKRLLNNGVD